MSYMENFGTVENSGGGGDGYDNNLSTATVITLFLIMETVEHCMSGMKYLILHSLPRISCPVLMIPLLSFLDKSKFWY